MTALVLVADVQEDTQVSVVARRILVAEVTARVETVRAMQEGLRELAVA